MKLKNFEKHVSPEITERGYDYFTSNCVDGLEKVSPGLWVAEVHGTEIYTVQVKMNQTAIKRWSCDCPYDFGPVCKHVVAVLYEIAEQANSGKEQKAGTKGKKAAKDKIREIAEKVTKEELWNFVLDLSVSDRSFKNRLIANFADLLDEDSPLKYKMIIKSYYKAAQDRHGFVDYRSAYRLTEPLYDLAEKAADLLAAGNKKESLTICKSLLEEVPLFLNNMDDSDGGVGDILYLVLNTLTEITDAAPPLMKDELFDYILEEFPKQKYHDFGFDDYFLELFPSLISSEEQEEKFMKLIDLQIKEKKSKSYSSYSVTQLIKTKADYLFLQGREEEALTLIEENLELPDFREMLVDRAISFGDFAQAKSLCLEGVEIAKKEHFPGHIQQWQQKLYEIARKEEDLPEQRKLARQLFFDNHYSMEWYKELKSLWPQKEWAEQCEELIHHIKGKHQRGGYGGVDTMARIFVEERYHSRLLKLLQLNSGNIRFTETYGSHLTEEYPEEVLELYENGVREAVKNTGRKEYKRVVAYLHKMRNMKGGDELVPELLKQFLQEYNNRPAMRDEFRKAFPAWTAEI